MHTKSINFNVLTLVSTLMLSALPTPTSSFVSLFSHSFCSSHPDLLFDHPICQPHLSQSLYNGYDLCWECSLLHMVIWLRECKLFEDKDFVCFYHCSIPNTLAQSRYSTNSWCWTNEWTNDMSVYRHIKQKNCHGPRRVEYEKFPFWF